MSKLVGFGLVGWFRLVELGLVGWLGLGSITSSTME